MVTYEENDDLNIVNAALAQLLQSRASASSELDRFRTLFTFCETKFRYLESVENSKMFRQAYIYIKECVELVPSLVALGEVGEVAEFMDHAMQMKAECEARFGWIDDAFNTAEKAKVYNPKARPYTSLLDSLARTLAATKAYGDLMQLAARTSSTDVIDTLGFSEGSAMAFAHAAKETGKEDVMLQAFYRAIAAPSAQSKFGVRDGSYI
jgi:hypothetical protein